jgi:hypothetical protein
MAVTKVADRQVVESIDLTSEVVNVLPVANGGTGAANLNALEQTANKNVNSGYAGLNSSGVVAPAQLGSGTASSANFLRGDNTWASAVPRLNTTASSATPSINSDTTDTYTITALAAAITSVTVTGSPVVGQKLMIGIKDNATARAITWGSSFVSSGVATLLATTVASKQHWMGVMWDGAHWACMAVDATGY